MKLPADAAVFFVFELSAVHRSRRKRDIIRSWSRVQSDRLRADRIRSCAFRRSPTFARSSANFVTSLTRDSGAHRLMFWPFVRSAGLKFTRCIDGSWVQCAVDIGLNCRLIALRVLLQKRTDLHARSCTSWTRAAWWKRLLAILDLQSLLISVEVERTEQRRQSGSAKVVEVDITGRYIRYRFPVFQFAEVRQLFWQIRRRIFSPIFWFKVERCAAVLNLIFRLR